MSETLIQAPASALRLLMPRAVVARDIQSQVKIGQAIRNQRVRDQRDLDEARREKQEWIQRTTDLLSHRFNQSGPMDQFNDWIGTILPEYAEFPMFVDLFDDEMRHRLGRLHAILKTLREIDEAKSNAAEASDAQPAAPAEENQPEMLTKIISVKPSVGAKMDQATHELSSAAVSQASAALIDRAGDEKARSAVSSFLEQLGIKTRAIDRTHENSPLVDLLPHDVSIVLMIGAGADQDPSDVQDAFDLGLCVGRVGAERVVVMNRAEASRLDDIGITQIRSDGSEAWQLPLARHLRRAGIQIDLNKLI